MPDGADPAALTRALTVTALVAARLGPLVWLAPWLGGRAVPALPRAVLLVALSVALAPLALAAAPGPPAGPAAFALAAAAEVVRGLVYAFAVSLPFHALEWAGQAVDLWRGSATAELVSPDAGEPTSPLGLLARGLGVAIFVVLGGHVAALRALGASLVSDPVGAAAPAALGAIAEGAARLAGDALALAVAVAAPAAVALVVVEVALGALARAAPQIPMFFAGMPLRAAVGLAAVALSLAATLPVVLDAFRRALTAAP